jgi:hypothetical protein
VIRWPWVTGEANRDLEETVPLLHYEVEVQKSTRLDYVLRAYQTQRDFDVNDEPSFRHVRWVSERIDPAAEEDYVDAQAPRWLYRNTAVGWTGKYYPIANSWADVYSGEAKAADVDDDWVKDFTLTLDVSGCVDAPCKVERAWKKVHELTDNSGTGKFWQNRPLKAVVASQTASSHEQVLLFRKLLATAGVKADTVFVTHPYGKQFDPKFPNSLHDDTVAWVRPDAGLPNGIFVDVSCEYCRPGVLRDLVDGANAVRVWGVAKRQGESEPHGELVKVVGDARSHDESRVESKVTLDEDGNLGVSRFHTYLGAEAAGTRRRGRGLNDATQRANVESWLATIYPQGKLLDFLPARCDKVEGRCEAMARYSVAQGAIASGGQVAVPLSMLQRNYEKTFTVESRAQGIRITGDNTSTETVTLAVPSGYKVAETPKDFEAGGGGFAVRVQVKVEPAKDGVPTMVIISRQLSRRQGRWPASDYEKARTAVRAWADLRQQAVLFTKL